MSLHYNGDNSYSSANGKKIYKFKASSKYINFSTQFCCGSIYNGFSAFESREVSSNGNVYDFSVDYNSIDKSNILNIHKYLMVKNNIENIWIYQKKNKQTVFAFLTSLVNTCSRTKCVFLSNNNAKFNLLLLIYILMSKEKNYTTIHLRLN